MASRQADTLTRLHRREVGLVTTAVERKVRALAKKANVADIDGWWARNLLAILRIVAPGFALLAEMTVKYLRSHAALEGVKLDPVPAVVDDGVLKTSLRVTGPVAFKKHMTISGDPDVSRRVMTSTLSRTAASRVLDGDRDTVMATFAETDQLVGWRRVINSTNPCAFCLLLVSRGAVYDKKSVGFQAHKPGCSCTAEPLYEHEEEPADVLALRDRWDEVTAGFSGQDAINAFRRSLAKDPAEGATPEA